MSANVTPNVTPPAAAPAPTPANSLVEVRIGFAVVAMTVALFLLGLCAYHLIRAETIAEGETWAKSFKNNSIWPIAVWSGLFGLFGLGIAALLIKGGPQADSPAWLCRTLGTALAAGGVALLCIAVFLLITKSIKTADTWVMGWSVLSAGLCIAGGVLLISDAPRQDASRLRLFLLGVGVSLGGLTFLLGLALAGFTYRDELQKGMDSWRDRPFVLIWPVVAFLAGLALTFFSIQPALPLIRTDQTIRRTVYGANLAVTALLLLGLLAFVNVLAYAAPMNRFFARGYDWTDSGLHALQPDTRTFLQGLKEPIKVYVILPRDSAITSDTITMLDNCRSVTPQFTYELVDTRSRETVRRRLELMREYNLEDPTGLLVVGGDGEKEKSRFAFVKYTDLIDQGRPDRRGSDASTYTYKGERALRNAMLSMTEGAVKIYFTSGHGELTLDDPMQMMMRRGGKGGELGKLSATMTERPNVKVEPLKLDRALKAIPNDASLVVIARPTRPFTPDEVKVLAEYASRDRKIRKEKVEGKGDLERDVEEVAAGKLLLLLDVILEDNVVVPNGLEPLLGRYGVRLGNNRVINLVDRGNPLDVIAITPPGPGSDNPILQTFHPNPGRFVPFEFRDVRTVEPIAERGGGAGAETLLFVHPRLPAWGEENFKTDPVKLRASRRTDKKFLEDLPDAPPSIAVVVSDRGMPPGMPQDAAHAAAGKKTPRMVVFGSSNWITDKELEGNESAKRLALFNSCVTWLQARHESYSPEVQPDDKKRKVYSLDLKGDEPTRLKWLPLGLMLTAVLMFGAGVWVVRRR